jgi:putative two-component system response regulator
MSVVHSRNDRHRILFVDDDVNILRSYRRLLRDWQRNADIEFTECPVDAWNRIQQQHYDVVISDYSMNNMNGLELLEKIRGNKQTRSTPVILVTGRTERHLWRRALELGAADLLHKPVDRDDLVARIHNVLALNSDHFTLAQENDRLSRRVRKHSEELLNTRLEMIARLAKAAEQRDLDTGNHVIRVARYAHRIALACGLSESAAQRILLGAPLHDVGKIGIPDAILLKPGRLSTVEWEVMKQHCQIGATILSQTVSPLIASFQDAVDPGAAISSQDPIMETARIIALAHHERWDGTGYPHSLSGRSIPVEARCVAIADVFDSLRSQRPYKPAHSVDQSLDMIQQGRETHFDPGIHDAFFSCINDILSIEGDLNEQLFADRAEAEYADQCPVC